MSVHDAGFVDYRLFSVLWGEVRIALDRGCTAVRFQISSQQINEWRGFLASERVKYTYDCGRREFLFAIGREFE